MRVLGYCRVSTEEQATEGFSLEGQAEKIRGYAQVHDMGPVEIIGDPGRSGKNLDRPGMQRLLATVDGGEVSHVVAWQWDRYSRTLRDLIWLADHMQAAGVGLHCVMEGLDLTSAQGRMMFNINGTFAQFYREQLSENVRMGMQQAVRQGRHVNRPKFGYALMAGELVPNSDADVVRRIFRLRGERASYREIEDATGVKYSTVGSIVRSRVYVGEVPFRGDWFPGHHDPLVSEQEWSAAQWGRGPVRRWSKHLLSGLVRCGLCGRAASVKYNEGGRPPLFVCRNRGLGCSQPARSANGLERAALLGVRLVAGSREVQVAVQRHLSRSVDAAGNRQRVRRWEARLSALQERRGKLLALYLDGRMGTDLLAQSEERLRREIAEVEQERVTAEREADRAKELSAQFAEVVELLRTLDVDALWTEADEKEKRVIVQDLVQEIAVFPDHLEVEVRGVPRLNVQLQEVGLTGGVADCSCRRGDLNPHGR